MDWSLYERELRHEKVKLNGDREKSFCLGGGGGGGGGVSTSVWASSFKTALPLRLSTKINVFEYRQFHSNI